MWAFAEAKSFHKEIAKNEGLLWLYLHYCKKDYRPNPQIQYQSIESALLSFRVMRIALITFAVIGWYVWVLATVFYGTYNWMQKYDPMAQSFTAIFVNLLWLALFIAVPILAVRSVWDKLGDLMAARIDQMWTTRSFKDEVSNLTGLTGPGDGIEGLIGIGKEFREHAIPSHVAIKCDLGMLQIAKEIKSSDLGINVKTPEDVESLKSQLKYYHGLCEHFAVINGDLRSYYTRAQESLKGVA